jgi:hypothetical protein
MGNTTWVHWASLAVTLIGASIALTAWICARNMDGVVIGGAIAIIAMWFRP